MKMKQCRSRGLVRCCPPLVTLGDRRALLAIISMLAGNELDDVEYINCVENSCEREDACTSDGRIIWRNPGDQVRVPAESEIFHMNFFIKLFN